MLCEKCGQREANVCYTEIVNGVVTEHNLCIECARTMDFGGQKYAALFDGESQLGRLISGLLGFAIDSGQSEEEQSERSAIACPVCHTSYHDFVKKSRFGCADCYEVFELLMEDHIKTIQGSDRHAGKKPMKSRGDLQNIQVQEKTAQEQELTLSREEKIAILEAQLKEALREEEYEAAARYRDAIRALKTEVSADE